MGYRRGGASRTVGRWGNRAWTRLWARCAYQFACFGRGFYCTLLSLCRRLLIRPSSRNGLWRKQDSAGRANPCCTFFPCKRNETSPCIGCRVLTVSLIISFLSQCNKILSSLPSLRALCECRPVCATWSNMTVTVLLGDSNDLANSNDLVKFKQPRMGWSAAPAPCQPTPFLGAIMHTQHHYEGANNPRGRQHLCSPSSGSKADFAFRSAVIQLAFSKKDKN